MAKGKTRIVREGLNRSVTHLLHRALQLALDFHAEAAGETSLTQRQFTVLSAAAAAEGMTQNDLVRATGIDRSTLADLVARMLAKGLLLRERSATDARANTVHVSEAGRAALGAGAGAAAAADERLLALLSPKKRETLLKILGGLAEVADEPPKVRAPRPPAASKGAASKGAASKGAASKGAASKPGADKKKKVKKVKKAKAPKEAKAPKDAAGPRPADDIETPSAA